MWLCSGDGEAILVATGCFACFLSDDARGESLKLRQECAFRKRIVERLGESLKVRCRSMDHVRRPYAC